MRWLSKNRWLQGLDLNERSLGYEPSEMARLLYPAVLMSPNGRPGVQWRNRTSVFCTSSRKSAIDPTGQAARFVSGISFHDINLSKKKPREGISGLARLLVGSPGQLSKPVVGMVCSVPSKRTIHHACFPGLFAWAADVLGIGCDMERMVDAPTHSNWERSVKPRTMIRASARHQYLLPGLYRSA